MPTDNRQCQVRTLRTLRTVSNKRCTRARMHARACAQSDLSKRVRNVRKVRKPSHLRVLGKPKPSRVFRAATFLEWVSAKHSELIERQHANFP